MAGPNPTRSELMKLKKMIKFARSGHKMLKKKQDGLILEFFRLLKQAKGVHGALTKQFIEAELLLDKAAAVEGYSAVQSASMAVKPAPDMGIATKNIMGVRIPSIDTVPDQKHFYERGYGIIGGSSRIDETAYAYEGLVDRIVQAAQTETAMRKLLEDIERTKRRVNALEYKVIPTLNRQKSFISQRLEEMERENIFRLKRIKAKTKKE